MECSGCIILLQLLKLDRRDVVEQLSYDGNLSKQMPLEPSYIRIFFFFVQIWMLLLLLEMKKKYIFHRPYLLCDGA